MGTVIKCVVAVSLMATTVAGGPANAQTAPGMNDLIGARGSSAESELSARGYTMSGSNGGAVFWWNARSRSCVSVAVDQGRVDSIQSGTPADCGQSGDGRANVGGALAGAAIIGLAAALASHHDKSNNRRNNGSYNAEYERGYHDGMYGAHYDNRDSEGYHSGFLAGEAESQNRRAANTPLVRGAPRSAQMACSARGDQTWRVPSGSTVPVSVFDYGQGNYDVTVASGHRRAHCSVNARGNVSSFVPG